MPAKHLQKNTSFNLILHLASIIALLYVKYNVLFSFLPEPISKLYQILHCPYLLEGMGFIVEYTTKIL